MKRSQSSTMALVSILAGALIASCGVGEKERKALVAEVEQSIADELKALREEVAAAKLAPDNSVSIELQGVGPATRIVTVDPSKKHSCKNPKYNCGHDVEWLLEGDLPEGWSVEIKEKAASPNKGCFAQPKLDDGNRKKSSGDPTPDCQKKAGGKWEYSVTLLDQAGAPKQTVDPLIVMDWSP